MIEYAIFKLYRTPKSTEYWDGGFETLTEARAAFKKTYSNDPEQPQDFAIFKITTTKVKTTWLKRKSKQRRASR